MPRIASSTIEQIKARADILDVVSDVVQLKQRGRNYFGLCPFHEEKTPSFSVNPTMGIFHCFGCGKGGNAVTFLMEYEKVDYIEALKRLAERYNIQIEWEGGEDVRKGEVSLIYELHELAAQFYREQLLSPKGSAARAYLESRQISLDCLEQFKIGYAPNEWDALYRQLNLSRYSPAVLEKSGLFVRKEGQNFYDRFRNRLMFPIVNLSGRTVAFGGRALDPQEEAKYLNSPETPIYFKSSILYGLYQAREAIQKKGAAILVEGYTDFLRLYMNGFTNVIASSGTALTFHHARLLHRFTNQIYICYDGDEAGQKASERAGFLMLKEALDVKVIKLPAADDPDSFLRQNDKAAFEHLYQQAFDFITFQLQLHAEELKSAASKSEYVEKLIVELAEIRNPVTRDLIVAEVAERLRIKEEHIQSQIRYHLRCTATVRPPSLNSQERNRELKLASAVDKAEFEILKILLTNHQAPQEKILSNLTVADFHHSELKMLAEKIFAVLKQQQELEPRALFDETLSPTQQSYLSRLIYESEDLQKITDLQVIINLTNDCLGVILTQEIDNAMRSTREQIRAAEKKGEDTFPLVLQLRELQKQRKAIEARLT